VVGVEFGASPRPSGRLRITRLRRSDASSWSGGRRSRRHVGPVRPEPAGNPGDAELIRAGPVDQPVLHRISGRISRASGGVHANPSASGVRSGVSPVWPACSPPRTVVRSSGVDRCRMGALCHWAAPDALPETYK